MRLYVDTQVLPAHAGVIPADCRPPTAPHRAPRARGGDPSSDIWARLYALLEAGVPVRLRVFDPKGGGAW